MDRNEKSTSDRRPSIDVSYQMSFHFAKRFQRRKLKCEKLTDDGHQKLTKGPGKSVELYRISEYSGFILVNGKLWDHKCLSDVTGSQKRQVSDCTSSTVYV